MIVEVNLATGLYNPKIITVTDNENLQIKMNGTTYPNLTYVLKAKNGGKFHQIKFNDKVIEIDRKELTYGILSAKIVVLANDVTVKEIPLENLTLQEVSKTLKVVPELEIVKNEFAKLQDENEKMREKVAELEKLCENTKELVIRLNGLTQKVGE